MGESDRDGGSDAEGVAAVSELTQVSLIKTLTDIGRNLDAAAEEIERLDAEAVRKRVEYKREYAKAFLTSTGSMDMRRYEADERTADALLDAETAEQVLRAAKENIRVLRDRLEIGRSLSALLRMEALG